MSRRRTLAPLLAISLLIVGVTPIAAQDAPSCAAPTASVETPAVPGGNEALNGVQPGPAPSGTPILCWTGSSGNAVLGTRAEVVGDHVFTLTDTGDAISFAPDGSEAWRVNLAGNGEGLLGGLATDGSLIFVGTPTGLVALSAADGSTTWAATIDPGPQVAAAGVFSPVVTGPNVAALVYTSTSRRDMARALSAFDRATGAQVWTQPVFTGQPAGTLTADDATIAVTEGDTSLVLRDAATGAEQLRMAPGSMGSRPVTPIVLTRDDFIVGLIGGAVTGRTRSEGKERWTLTTSSGFVAAITVNGQYAFINASTTLLAVDAGSGAQVWEATMQAAPPPFLYTPIPAIVDGQVILGTTDVNSPGALLAFDAGTGTPTWRVDLAMFGVILSPVVAGERIYAPSFDISGPGGVLAFGMPG